MSNRLASSTTGITAHLHLLIHARRKLVLDDANTMALARLTRIDLTISTACSLTGLADVLLVPDELGGRAVVEVSLGDLDLDLHIMTSGLARASTKVSMAAEETTEEIEGVVAATTSSAAVAEVLDAFVAGLVVDLAGFGVAQHIVGVGDFDKLVMGFVIATGKVGLVGVGR